MSALAQAKPMPAAFPARPSYLELRWDENWSSAPDTFFLRRRSSTLATPLTLTPPDLLEAGQLHLELPCRASRRAPGDTTVGARWWGARGKFDYNYEFLGQFGNFGTGDIAAWVVVTGSGYSQLKMKFAPRFSLRVDIASGDRNRTGCTLGTFNPLFSTTAYSGKIGLIGASNMIDLTPNVRLRLHKRVYFLPESSVFWRQSTKGGIYSVLGPAW